MDAAQPPRHLLRRFCAYAIDVALAWLIAFLGMALVLDDPILGKLDRETQVYTLGAGLHSGSFAPPVYVSSRVCGEPVDLMPVLRNYVAPATITKAEACFERKNGVPVGGVATLTLAETPEAGELAGQNLRVPLTLETGHRYADALAFFVFFAGSILGLRFFGTTPGKRIMGLRVIGAAPIPALRRELVRSLPHLLTVPAFLAINLIVQPMPAVPPIAQGIAVTLELLSIAAVLGLWIYPAVRWRGAFFHDHWLGLSVVRARDLPADPLPAA